jgi:hypothetical protein
MLPKLTTFLEDDEDEEQNGSNGEEPPQLNIRPATTTTKSKSTMNETDETVYEDTDSSSVASPVSKSILEGRGS